MPCQELTEDLLLDLVRGELELERAAAARMHLDACADCRARFEETRSLLGTLDRAARRQEIGLSPDRIEKILAHAAAKGRPEAARGSHSRLRTASQVRRAKTVSMAVRRRNEPNVLAMIGGLAAAAALLFIIVLSAGPGRRPRPTGPAIAKAPEVAEPAIEDSGEVVLVPEPEPIPKRGFTSPEPFTRGEQPPATTVVERPAPAPAPVPAPAVQPQAPAPLAQQPPAPAPAPVPEQAPATPERPTTQAVVATVPLTNVAGAVRLLRAGASGGGEPVGAGEIALAPGDRLVAEGVARFTLGYRHRVWLNDGARAGARRDGAAIRTILASGEMFADVVSAADHKTEVFNVETPHGTVHVRGTRFDVRVEEKRTIVGVAEGTVVCRGGRTEVTVREGNQSEIRGGYGALPPKKANAHDIGAWVRSLETYLWIEAESGRLVEGSEVASDAGASGGRFARATADGGGLLQLDVHPHKPGAYRLWGRVRNGTKRADFSTRLNDGAHMGMLNDYNAADWHWIPGPVFEMSAGAGIVSLWFAGKEAGVDRVLLTTDSGFQPRDEAVSAPSKPREGSSRPAFRAAWDPAQKRGENGLALTPCKDGPFEETAAAGAPAVKARKDPAVTGPHYLYYRVNDRLWKDRKGAAVLHVSYHAPSGGEFIVEYDSADAALFQQGTVKRADGQDTSTDGDWKVRAFTLPDARFANRQNAASDFRIAVPEGKELVIRSVSLELMDQ
jgi:ferric-dicitrate binding protein FerR (iron transport regulator)